MVGSENSLPNIEGDELTVKKTCGSLRPGNHVRVEGVPCSIQRIMVQKPGKHGYAKAVVTLKKVNSQSPPADFHFYDISKIDVYKTYQIVGLFGANGTTLQLKRFPDDGAGSTTISIPVADGIMIQPLHNVGKDMRVTIISFNAGGEASIVYRDVST